MEGSPLASYGSFAIIGAQGAMEGSPLAGYASELKERWREADSPSLFNPPGAASVVVAKVVPQKIARDTDRSVMTDGWSSIVQRKV
jgi:hypothetical protein